MTYYQNIWDNAATMILYIIMDILATYYILIKAITFSSKKCLIQQIKELLYGKTLHDKIKYAPQYPLPLGATLSRGISKFLT